MRASLWISYHLLKVASCRALNWEDSYGVWGRYQHPTGQEEREKDEQELMKAVAGDGCLDLRDSRPTFPS